MGGPADASCAVITDTQFARLKNARASPATAKIAHGERARVRSRLGNVMIPVSPVRGWGVGRPRAAAQSVHPGVGRKHTRYHNPAQHDGSQQCPRRRCFIPGGQKYLPGDYVLLNGSADRISPSNGVPAVRPRCER